MLAKGLSEVLRTTKRHLNKLEGLNLFTVRDLLLYFPRTYNDSSSFTKISDIRMGEVNTVKGEIKSIFSVNSKFGKKITQAVLSDGSGVVGAVWFGQPHLSKMLFKGMEVVLTGKAKMAFNRLSLQSPSYEVVKSGVEQIHSGRIVPVYHETEGISSKWIREKLKPLLERGVGLFEESLPRWVVERYGLMSLAEAIYNVHFPKDSESLNLARYRLGFEELLGIQLEALEKRMLWQVVEEENVRVINGGTEEVERLVEGLGFELTGAQERVLSEVFADMKRGVPMYRLVQGDVGSGKTVVAALSALKVVKSGYQVAVMAPTEILASQHYKTFVKLLSPFGLNVQFIAGSTKRATKEDVKRQMLTGTVDVIVGTHALIQDGIGFKDLGLAIIDEQHRFGVAQREVLRKAGSPHLLSMTATPIPRTLAITVYGDQDLSSIDEMPVGRKPIVTRIVPEKKRGDAYRWIESEIAKGRQAYVICPLIEGSEVMDLKSVTEEFERLNEEVFVDVQMACLHGKMKQEEKDAIMKDFKDNKLSILVSTSVIEVGIDVPNATIMLIEGAERFGLSQLHQFRGRVGRGEKQSYCFLFTSEGASEKNVRLKALERHGDGFKLSEIDLELRGPGEVYGVRQSGIPDLKMASLSDFETIKKARECARLMMERGVVEWS